jgi:hypothetical protein
MLKIAVYVVASSDACSPYSPYGSLRFSLASRTPSILSMLLSWWFVEFVDQRCYWHYNESSLFFCLEFVVRRPYIGICDFTDQKQSEAMLKLFPPNFSHDLMVGVMMSRKTLFGQPTKWADVFPKKETIKDIFIDDPRAFNTIHYADYETGQDRDWSLRLTLEPVVEYGGSYLRAIQLDMIWPDVGELKRHRRSCAIPIILQVGADAMKLCGDDPLRVRDKLAEYGDTIDYVLFDKSMGRGKGMDAALLAQYVGVLVSDLPHLMPAVGGGLGPDTMHLGAPLISAFRQLSIDAQGQMRSSGDIMHPIEWDRAARYLSRSVELYMA